MTNDYFIEREISRDLLERLSYIKINPANILCLGPTAQYLSLQLQTKFPQAMIFTKSGVNKFDLIIANCHFNPRDNLPTLFHTLHQTLNNNGLLMFSTYGPGTLNELFVSNQWPDMHNIGDFMLQAQFANPVVDQEKLKIEYLTLRRLLEDLRESGRYEIDKMDSPLLEQPYVAELEIVYGLAWANKALPPQYKDPQGNVFIAADSIKVL